MTKAAFTSLALLLFCSTVVLAQNTTPIEDAAVEGVRRQAYTIDLRKKLADGQAAQRKGDLLAAAKFYSDCLDLIKKIGPGVEAERQQVLAGHIATRLQLAEQSQRRGNFNEASDHIGAILKVDPRNEAALAARTANEKLRHEQEGRFPDNETIAKIPDIHSQSVSNATLVQDAKLLYEAGRYDDAMDKLRIVLKSDSDNKAAFYYVDLIMEQRFGQESRLRESLSKKRILEIVQAWNAPVKRDLLPVPNPYARTNLVNTGRGRQVIYSKMERIRINTLEFDGVPLNNVIQQLNDDVRKRDPDKKGVNFILNSSMDPPPAPPAVINPATGLPEAAPAADSVDIGAIQIRIKPALTDLTLQQALDAIVKVAERPIKYSVEDYAVLFSLRTAEPQPLFTRWFKIDPNTFRQGLQGVTTFSFGAEQGGGGGGQGGGGGGGGRGGGGGGGGRGGGGGGGLGGGGQGGQGNQQIGSEYVGVSLAPGGFGGLQGQGGAAGGVPGQPGQPGQGAGVNFLTQVTDTQTIIPLIRTFFETAGVLLTPPKAIFFNDRLGMLMVRATLSDLDIIEQAVQVLNLSPPQMTIEAKFAEVSQDDTKALGFDWFLGNITTDNGKVGFQGGTAPSFGGASSASFNNPSGIFPGPGLAPGVPGPFAIPPSATDNVLTSGLRNSGAMGNSIPAIGTLTGILTDPQFRLVIRALEQRQGVDLLSAPKVTTLSGRQAQIKIVDVRYIVTDLDLSQTASGGGNVTQLGAQTGGGAIGSIIQPLATPIELGPVLDVVPSVSADGYTVQMVIIPTIKEFIGYDLATAQLFSPQVQSVGTAAANPLTTTTPLPIFRLRQVVTSAIVWDGQTVVLGGLISEDVTKIKDKVPILGDLPIAGKLFRSESSQSRKKNLLIFVTPTIIDPAGNRVHSEEEMPFALNSAPPQKAVTP